jgi:hypothetical protein
MVLYMLTIVACYIRQVDRCFERVHDPVAPKVDYGPDS